MGSRCVYIYISYLCKTSLQIIALEIYDEIYRILLLMNKIDIFPIPFDIHVVNAM